MTEKQTLDFTLYDKAGEIAKRKPGRPATGRRQHNVCLPLSDSEKAQLDAIAEIVAQGDKNTVALNACVDSYNQMRDLLNGNK